MADNQDHTDPALASPEQAKQVSSTSTDTKERIEDDAKVLTSTSETGERESADQTKDAGDEDHGDHDGHENHSEDDAPPLPEGPVPETAEKAENALEPSAVATVDDNDDDDDGPPPLPPGPVPETAEKAQGLEDWEAILDAESGNYYYYNHATEETTWDKPLALVEAEMQTNPKKRKQTADYASRGFFNRFTGKWQQFPVDPLDDDNVDLSDDVVVPPGVIVPFNETMAEKRSRNQLNVFYDASSVEQLNGGKSLKAERQQQKPSKKQVEQFRRKKQERRERNQRSWLLN